MHPELAVSYLHLLAAQPGRPIALFAPRRVGKTYFLDHDLAPAAANGGLLPVYADIWLHRASPLEAINHALEEALDDINVPNSATGKIAKTPIKRIGALSATLAFGDEPTRRNLPQQPELRFDALIALLDENAMCRVFAHIGYKPALMKDIVKEMSAEGIADVDLGLQHFIEDERQVTGWQSVLNGLDRIEQLTLIVLANGLPPTGKETLDALGKVKNANVTLSKVRTALARMRKAGILSKPAADYRIEDSLFADYIAKTVPIQTLITPQKPASARPRMPSRKK